MCHLLHLLSLSRPPKSIFYLCFQKTGKTFCAYHICFQQFNKDPNYPLFLKNIYYIFDFLFCPWLLCHLFGYLIHLYLLEKIYAFNIFQYIQIHLRIAYWIYWTNKNNNIMLYKISFFQKFVDSITLKSLPNSTETKVLPNIYFGRIHYSLPRRERLTYLARRRNRKRGILPSDQNGVYSRR